MKNKTVNGILALVVVTALSFGVIAGSRMLAKDVTGETGSTEAKITEELDITGTEHIDQAVKTEDGYQVTVRQKGYGGDIVMKVSFDSAAAAVTKLEILEHNETESLGANIAEADFLNQFQNISAPVYLPGMSAESEGTDSETAPAQDTPDLEALDNAEFTDGDYTAKGTPDSNGFTEEVTMTVKDGKITKVNWDAVMEDGTKKSVMSENGEYTMTEDGPTWKEQSEALAAALIKNQSLSFLTTNEEGKTDAVSGVSISVGGFINLSAQCMEQAAGLGSTDPLADAVLTDGEFTAKGEPDSNGFTDEVTITVKDGKITKVNWDAVMEDGTKKSVMSENGEYTMTEDGPTWKEQSEALAAALIKNQSLSFLTTNEEGKTDAVSGVSISVGGFINLAQQCLSESAGVELEASDSEAASDEDSPAENAAPQNGTEIDAVSGATVSSTAVVKGINLAYDFLQTVK